MDHPSVNIIDSIAWGPFKVSLRGDNIMQVEIEAEQEVSLGNVKEIIEAMRKLGNEKKYPVLVLPGEYTLPTQEARQFMASPGNPYALAEAYLLHSLPQKLVGNFFLQFNKPQRPTRIFTKYNEALEWLKSFIA